MWWARKDVAGIQVKTAIRWHLIGEAFARSCMRLRERAKHIRRQKSTIIHLSWTTKNNFLAVPGRLTTSLLCRQIHGVSATDPFGHGARASGECSTVIVMPLWGNRPGLQASWSEAKTGEWTKNTAGTVNKRPYSVCRCDNWRCDFGCQRFHWSSQGVKLIIVATPNFSSFMMESWV